MTMHLWNISGPSSQEQCSAEQQRQLSSLGVSDCFPFCLFALCLYLGLDSSQKQTLILGFECNQFIKKMIPENSDRGIGTSDREGKEVKKECEPTVNIWGSIPLETSGSLGRKWFSKCGARTSNIDITCEHIRSTSSHVLL